MSPVMKARIGGAWVETDKSGAVRVDGVTVPFSSGPEVERLAWALEPAGTDYVDEGFAYNMGIQFEVDVSKPCHGVSWRVPDTVLNPPGGTHAATLWRVSDTSLVALKEFVPVPGGYQDILFDTPTAALDIADTYVAAVYTRHYVHRSPGGSPYPTSPSGNIISHEGRLVPYDFGPNVYPHATFNAWYYVSPLIEV